MLKKETPFRIWLNRKWMEYQDELSEINQISSLASPDDYFHQYRWWLKNQFKKEMFEKNTLL